MATADSGAPGPSVPVPSMVRVLWPAHWSPGEGCVLGGKESQRADEDHQVEEPQFLHRDLLGRELELTEVTLSL